MGEKRKMKIGSTEVVVDRGEIAMAMLSDYPVADGSMKLIGEVWFRGIPTPLRLVLVTDRQVRDFRGVVGLE